MRRRPGPQPIPIIRPPRFAQGGGVAPAFGMSGAPGVPTADEKFAQDLAIQYADDERGRFTERIFQFPPFTAVSVTASTTNSQTLAITSNRTDFVRLVALRGVIQVATTPLTGLEAANVLLQVSINGEENLVTTGNQSFPTPFAILFSNESAPWFWFAAPPRLRVGDVLLATVSGGPAAGADTPITPSLAARLVDDKWWRELYGT